MAQSEEERVEGRIRRRCSEGETEQSKNRRRQDKVIKDSEEKGRRGQGSCDLIGRDGEVASRTDSSLWKSREEVAAAH